MRAALLVLCLIARPVGAEAFFDIGDNVSRIESRNSNVSARHAERLAFNVFIGAARLDLATPAYGYYYGGGFQFKELVSNWDLSIDLRIADEVARDNVLPSDPQGGNPDNFRDIFGVSVYLSRRF